MNAVVQADPTGCAIASVAALARQPYATIKRAAAEIGIAVDDPALWSDTKLMRRLLTRFHISAGRREEEFVSWSALPSCALLSIKWHREKSGGAWHWVVFVRDETGGYVLDPKRALRTNVRRDFGRIKPKWFIRILRTAAG